MDEALINTGDGQTKAPVSAKIEQSREPRNGWRGIAHRADGPKTRGPLFADCPETDDTNLLDAVVISDIHLGCDNCQAKPLTAFLESILAGELRTRRLIINGDMFDSIDFRRLRKTHWKVLSMIRHLSDKLEVIWTCGNHDGPADFFSHLLGVEVRDEFIFASGNRRLLVLHGHLFDDFIDHHPILTWTGDLIYNVLQKLDRRHYIARLAKARSKTFLHCIDKVQKKSIAYCWKKGCDIVLCGHTHHAVETSGRDVSYFNSGCWTEIPSTYLTVHNGVVRLCRYAAAATRTAGTGPAGIRTPEGPVPPKYGDAVGVGGRNHAVERREALCQAE